MMKAVTRSSDLLRKAAIEFDEMRQPFTTEWLSTNSVTLDECGDLSEAIATAIRVYLELPLETRLRYLAASLMKSP